MRRVQGDSCPASYEEVSEIGRTPPVTGHWMGNVLLADFKTKGSERVARQLGRSVKSVFARYRKLKKNKVNIKTLQAEI